MASVTNFLANNYIWFLLIALFFLLALIGYFIEQKGTNKGNKKAHEETISLNDNVEELKMDTPNLSTQSDAPTSNVVESISGSMTNKVQNQDSGIEIVDSNKENIETL